MKYSLQSKIKKNYEQYIFQYYNLYPIITILEKSLLYKLIGGDKMCLSV